MHWQAHARNVFIRQHKLTFVLIAFHHQTFEGEKKEIKPQTFCDIILFSPSVIVDNKLNVAINSTGEFISASYKVVCMKHL